MTKNEAVILADAARSQAAAALAETDKLRAENARLTVSEREQYSKAYQIEGLMREQIAVIERLTKELAEAIDGCDGYRKMALLREAEATAEREAHAKTKAALAASQSSRDAIEGHWKDIAAEIGKAGPMAMTVTESAKRVVGRCLSAEAVLRVLREWLNSAYAAESIPPRRATYDGVIAHLIALCREHGVSL